MDYDSDSSDFHFPADTGLAKLASPLSFKAPEARDWALQEFMQTLSEKPCMETDNLLSFKQYIPVQEYDDNDDDDFNYGPPKLSLPTYEEKDFLTQISQHFLDLERKELHDILKGGFSLVQNDIQTNSGASPFASAHPDITWFDEAFDYGHNNTNIISNLENVEFRRASNFSPFEQQHNYHHRSHRSSILSEEEEEDVEDIEEDIEQDMVIPTTIVYKTTTQPAATPSVVLHQPIEIHKPLPALPPTTINNNNTTNKKKGLKYKLKSKLIKTFKHKDQEQQQKENTNDKKVFLQKTKKFIRKIFPVTTSSSQ